MGDSGRLAGCDGATVVKSLSSVSIQTVPVMTGPGGPGHGYGNGEISTISRTVNGGTRIQVTDKKKF